MLFDDLERKEQLIDLLDGVRGAQGVRIFIGEIVGISMKNDLLRRNNRQPSWLWRCGEYRGRHAVRTRPNDSGSINLPDYG